jgi:hypothetical protein
MKLEGEIFGAQESASKCLQDEMSGQPEKIGEGSLL